MNRNTGQRARQPKGIPIGGEFAPEHDGGPATSLDDLTTNQDVDWGAVLEPEFEPGALTKTPTKQLATEIKHAYLTGTQVDEYASRLDALLDLGSHIAQQAEKYAGITAEEVRAQRDRAIDANIQDADSGDYPDLQESMDMLSQTRKRVWERYGATALEYELNAAPLEQQDAVWQRLKQRRELAEQDPEFLAAKRHSDEVAARFDKWLSCKEVAKRQAKQHVYNATVNGLGGIEMENKKRLADGYIKALAEVRPLGGTLELHANTTKAAKDAFAEAATVFPQDWIAQSNQSDHPLAKVGKQRAHYSHQGAVPIRQTMPKSVVVSGDTNAELPPLEDYSYPDVSYEYLGLNDAGNPTWRKTQYETRPQKPGERAPSRNWEPYADSTGRYWRKPKYTERPIVGYDTISTIRTRAQPPTIAGVSNTFAVSVHEATHRFEAVNPLLGQAQHEWLASRQTTDGQKILYGGNRYRGSQEAAVHGDFVDDYVGKVYGVGQTHFEVLSTGAAALFGGTMGALIGLDANDKADLQHRDFVLGTLAAL